MVGHDISPDPFDRYTTYLMWFLCYFDSTH